MYYFQLEDIFRTMVITRLSTGSKILDSILTVILLFYTPKFIQFLRNLGGGNFQIDFFNKSDSIWCLIVDYFKNYPNIELQGKILRNKYGEYKYIFSDNLRGILKHINSNLENFEIYSLQEVVTDQQNSCEHTFSNIYISDYIINQTKGFIIYPDIECFITIDKDKYYQCESDGKSNGDCTNLTLKLMSKTNNASHIISFIRKCHKQYADFINCSVNDNQYYFGIDSIDLIENKVKYIQYEFKSDVTFDNIFFEDKQNIKSNLDFFINNKSYYQNNGIPYRLGILLHGHPGCGKTSLIKAIANYTKRHIVNVNFKSIDNKKILENIFFSNRINSFNIDNEKKIFVIEEFDVNGLKYLEDRCIDYEKDTPIREIIQKKDNSKIIKNEVSKEQNISLGSVLELLDGILENPGRIIIITTNDIKYLDKALLRPGRIDTIIKFRKCNQEMFSQIFYKFFKDKIDSDKITTYNHLIKLIPEYTYSPAELVNLCNFYRHNLSEFFEHIKKNQNKS